MATIRALPSISTLLNQPQTSVSRLVDSGRTVLLARRWKQVKLSILTQFSSNPRGVIQGIADSTAQGQSGEELEIRSYRGNDFPEKVKGVEDVEGVESVSVSEFLGSANGALESFARENARELVIGSLVFALVCLPDEHALALGPGGPLMEEFWDNVRRYGFYFFTVVSGGLYSLAKPLLDLLKDPSTQILVAIAVTGTFYLMYLTVSTMLGLNDFDYQYAQ